jgi:hypothetical protein
MKNGLIIDNYGVKYYYLNDLLHREDGPAKEWRNGDKEWWINGKRHREDGPAVEFENGDKWYYLENQRYSEQNYWKELKRRKSLSYMLSKYIGNLPK